MKSVLMARNLNLLMALSKFIKVYLHYILLIMYQLFPLSLKIMLTMMMFEVASTLKVLLRVIIKYAV